MNFQKSHGFFAFWVPKGWDSEISAKNLYFHAKTEFPIKAVQKKVMSKLAASFLIRSFLIRLVSNSVVSNSAPGDELEMSALYKLRLNL